MMNVLKYPPIKYSLKKIPDNLVYYSHKNKHYHDFMMSTTTKPFSTCYAYCNKGNYYNNEGYFPSLLVYMIKSNPQGSGLGSKMLDVMSNFSKKQGCEGRFHLFSTTQFSPNRIPHIFYRKYGMSTGYAQIDKKLDKFIKMGKPATCEDFDSILMHYSPSMQHNKKQKLTIFERVKKFLHIGNIK